MCKGALVRRGVLSGRAPSVHLRPAVSCRLLLCAGGLIDVRLSCPEAPGRRACGDARPLCCPRRQVDSGHRHLARREYARQQRAEPHPGTDSVGEHHQVGLRKMYRDQQLSPRLPQGKTTVRRHPVRCALLWRRHVPQGRPGHRGVESAECGEVLAIAARNSS